MRTRPVRACISNHQPDIPSNQTGRQSGTGAIFSGRGGCAMLALAATVLLVGCDEKNAEGGLSSRVGNSSYSVIGSIRPKADPAVMQRIREEEEAARNKEQAEMAAANNNQMQAQQSADPSNRDLSPVDTSPISGIANMLGFGQNNQRSVSSPGPMPSMPGMPVSSVPTPPPTMSYGNSGGGGAYPGGGGFIPPPPAVSLNTQAQAYPGPDPYANPYANPYAANNPYMNPYMQAPQQAMAPMPAHPAGSMFSSGGNGGSSRSSEPSAEETAARNKRASMVVITPTGMESRSPYKQRDDLKVLLKSAFAKEVRDEKTMLILAKTDVGLPGESTRGNISLTQRQIDNLFRTPALDKKLLPLVKKIETDVAQAYYRYLYAFNRYSLTQQQVAARRQEVEVADSAAEKQRAAADMSSAQQDAESSKEDLRAAQTDLASLAGAAATRSIITKVTGTAPSIESLAVADSDSSGGANKKDDGFMGSLNVFNRFGKGKGGGGDTANGDSAPAQANRPAPKAAAKKKGKRGDGPSSSVDTSTASAAPESSPPDPAPSPPAPSVSPARTISFELKNVQTFPRKSVLKVSIRNSGVADFNVDPEAVCVLEGASRLAEAAVSAQFDSTTVASNQEIAGTITIFGRPWNDKLSVSISDGRKSIGLRR